MKPSIGPDFELPVFTCPHCQVKLDRAFAWGNKHNPKPGDASICFYCGGIFIFGDNLMLREPQGNEFKQLAGDKEILSAQKMIAEFKKEHRH